MNMKAEKTEETMIDTQIQELMNSEGSSGKPKKQKRHWGKKRKAAAVLIVLVAGIAAWTGIKGQKPVLTPVTTEQIQVEDIQSKLSVTGPVSGTDSVEVVSKLHAEILDLKAKEGDKVEEGQVIAVLDPTDIQRQVDIAQNEYDLAVVNQKDKEKEARTGYDKACQDYRAAQADFDRNNILFQAGDISKADMEKITNTRDDAKRTMDSYTLKNGKPTADESLALQIKTAEFNLQQKKRDLEETNIKSPISGTVVRVNVKVGRFADTTDNDKPMFEIDNLDVLEMKIKVSEYSIGKVQLGQKATIRADILNGETVEGEVSAISPTGEEKGSGSTERVIPIKIRILDNSKLIAGINAKAEILLDEAKDAVVVSSSSIIEDEDGSKSVAVVQDGQIHMVPVEIGVESDIKSQIIPAEDLAEGALVVLTPDESLTEGMAVQAMPTM